MQELVLRKQRLERQITKWKWLDRIHWVFCLLVGSFVYVKSSPNLMLVGLIVLIYGFIVSFKLPFMPDLWNLDLEIRLIDRKLSDYESVHQELDSLRDEMLFDDDPTYWITLESLVDE